MPTREDIDSFKNTINLWGDEPAVMEALGETIEDVQPPEPSLAESLGMEELEGGGDLSLDALLSQAGLEEEAAPEEPEPLESFEIPGGPEEPEGLGDLGDLGDLTGPEELEGLGDLGDLAGPEELEELGDLGGPEELEELGDLGGPEELEELGDLGGPEELEELGDLGGPEEPEDLAGLEAFMEPSAMEEPEEPPVEELSGMEDLGELGDLGDLGDLTAGAAEPEEIDLGDFESPGPEDTEMEVEEEFDLTSPDEEIPELSGMEEIGMEEPEEGAMQFSLGDFGEEFNFQEGISFDEDMDTSLDSLDTLDDTFMMEEPEEGEAEEEERFEISEDNMESLQDTLRLLPLNLKMAVQDLLAEADLTSERYGKLIDLLIRGSAPRQISAEYFNITGKKVELPRGYLKQTGREFERKKIGFFYQFQEKGWPLLRLLSVILVVLGLTVFLSFQYLYRPLQAYLYYNRGVELIRQDAYEEADEYFRKAYFGWSLGVLDIHGWPRKGRFLQYAEEYRERRAFNYASDMYEGLIGEYRQYVDAYLEYGKYLTDVTGEYEKSATILSMGLDQDMYNYQLTLALGDNYMRWSEEDPARLEDARYQYATAAARYSGRDEVMLRMLRYFIRRQNDDQINILSNIYGSKTSIRAESYFTSETFAALGGYYIDNNRVSEAKDFLFRANELNVSVPEVHYQLSRYFRKTYNTGQETQALQKALYYMDLNQPLSSSQIFMKIAIHRRRGEIAFVEGRHDEAENEYLTGIRLLENSQVRGLIGTRQDVGELYADMGNLHFDIHGDLAGALDYYLLAEKNQYRNGTISYRKGFVYYDSADYDRAVLEFEEALKQVENKRNSRFALANSLVKRQNYFGALNLYNELLRELKREESSLPYLAPEDILEHRQLVGYFVRIYNNLGYVNYQLARRSSDPEKQSQALLYLTRAADYADRLDRDPETGVRTRPEDSMVFQNTMALIKPMPQTDVYMYEDIPRSPNGFTIAPGNN